MSQWDSEVGAQNHSGRLIFNELWSISRQMLYMSQSTLTGSRDTQVRLGSILLEYAPPEYSFTACHPIVEH